MFSWSSNELLISFQSLLAELAMPVYPICFLETQGPWNSPGQSLFFHCGDFTWSLPSFSWQLSLESYQPSTLFFPVFNTDLSVPALLFSANSLAWQGGKRGMQGAQEIGMMSLWAEKRLHSNCTCSGQSGWEWGPNREAISCRMCRYGSLLLGSPRFLWFPAFFFFFRMCITLLLLSANF